MTPEGDLIVDRRRLKRRLAIWRTAAVVAVVALAVAMVGPDRATIATPSHVARLTVSGVILEDRERDEALAKLAKDPKAKALLVSVDSPGGSFVGGESLYRALRRVAEHKPVIAVMGSLATSAGYMAAIAAEHIVAYEGTVTGSIGVLMQTTDVTGLLEKLGVKAEAIKSAPLKAVPSPFEALTDSGREATRAVVADMYGRFIEMVAERRGLDRPAAAGLADGRVYTGRQAVANRLIDSLGGEPEARAWLEREKGIAATLPIREVTVGEVPEQFLQRLSITAKKMFLPEPLMLDGLVSLWHLDRAE